MKFEITTLLGCAGCAGTGASGSDAEAAPGQGDIHRECEGININARHGRRLLCEDQSRWSVGYLNRSGYRIVVVSSSSIMHVINNKQARAGMPSHSLLDAAAQEQSYTHNRIAGVGVGTEGSKDTGGGAGTEGSKGTAATQEQSYTHNRMSRWDAQRS